MMTLSMIAGLVASLVVASLIWDTLEVVGADVPKTNIQENLYLLWRFICGLFGH